MGVGERANPRFGLNALGPLLLLFTRLRLSSSIRRFNSNCGGMADMCGTFMGNPLGLVRTRLARELGLSIGTAKGGRWSYMGSGGGLKPSFRGSSLLSIIGRIPPSPRESFLFISRGFRMSGARIPPPPSENRACWSIRIISGPPRIPLSRMSGGGPRKSGGGGPRKSGGGPRKSGGGGPRKSGGGGPRKSGGGPRRSGGGPRMSGGGGPRMSGGGPRMPLLSGRIPISGGAPRIPASLAPSNRMSW